ncbi:head decoration protein [Frateuria aurantia]|uniref:Bacteriophage lambda head decoration protein D n=1 Tax=Frateuria aurantia (strain ATCC 33424 / DSM 6220 / KCTC 2777 / LMG 1558 / NBRC 3245 / NCIMB 13370) TaxID=767434 RepID=H8L2J3_FRAAD|nr:head decoration protein [Frateuria aurantia]AFC85460.1 hypothetical protein Fraau_0996 [Frateuria aurantia DSM 6220]
MTTLTMNPRTGEFLLSEAMGTRSRDQVSLAATAAYIPAGTVMAKATDGTWAPYADPVAAAAGTSTGTTSGTTDTTGTETTTAATTPSEVGVLYRGAQINTDTQPAVMVTRDAELDQVLLIGLTDTASSLLAAQGLILR